MKITQAAFQANGEILTFAEKDKRSRQQVLENRDDVNLLLLEPWVVGTTKLRILAQSSRKHVRGTIGLLAETLRRWNDGDLIFRTYITGLRQSKRQSTHLV
mmetsp:Transcript_36213/g.57951  ORF Transcript_36213/g.57951 Transcript_36213/m.57951 type:complete len:101 (-) Transcript_36213:2798-3100(-)